LRECSFASTRFNSSSIVSHCDERRSDDTFVSLAFADSRVSADTSR
jgi:hypothetical protein